MDSSTYRRIIGHFATGVTVVTTAVRQRLHGMTANAVTSVSLDPLLLAVCVDNRAHAHGELLKAGHFAVNVLSADQEAMASLFATRARPEEGRLRGVPFTSGTQGSPLLDGCLAHLECSVDRHFAAGDHTIFIGRVLDGAASGSKDPLLFFRGEFWRPTSPTG